jgi:hypothetical protein
MLAVTAVADRTGAIRRANAAVPDRRFDPVRRRRGSRTPGRQPVAALPGIEDRALAEVLLSAAEALLVDMFAEGRRTHAVRSSVVLP